MNKETKNSQTLPIDKICGIIMPIATIDDCAESHWNEVQSIISEAVETAGYKARIVSDSDDSGVIQKRIVQNIYDDEIVICDVSCKNPNVMFELGMRLAFDKPTIVIKDDKTGFSFDTGVIEHVIYPRDLNYCKINEFKKKLADKIIATLTSAKDPKYSVFLKHFREIKPKTIEVTEGSLNEVVLNRIDELSTRVGQLDRNLRMEQRNRDTHRIITDSDKIYKILGEDNDNIRVVISNKDINHRDDLLNECMNIDRKTKMRFGDK